MTDRLTDADLDAIEQRASQWASPLAIKCPSCGANPGDRCYGNGAMYRVHGERREAARQRVIADVPALLAEVRRLRAAEDRVREVHEWRCLECDGIDPDASPMCADCYEPWPCPTIAALDGGE